MSEVEFKMDKFSIRDKIVFRKGVSDLIYADLTKEALAHLKSQQRVDKLETQLKHVRETNKAWNLKAKLLKEQVADLTAQNSLLQPLATEYPTSTEQPASTEQHVPAGQPTSSAKPLAKIQAYKKRSKIPIKDIQLSPQNVQLQ